MRSSVVLAAALCAVAAVAACRRDSAAPAALAPQLSGSIELAALSRPVRVVRDRWGIPHIYADSAHDLFVAQGFVQAQDRLFQMDLWRRSAQGRLSEVLGPNFIERDAMTRRVQYRGDLAREWGSYGDDVKSIAEAFVQGVNAWAAAARERPPEEFVLAGWLPDLWSADDLLNRTDGFDVRAVVDLVAQRGMDDTVADAVRRVGAAPFFTLLSGPVGAGRPPREDRADTDGKGDRELVSALAMLPKDETRVEVHDSVLHVDESRRKYEHPALRYLVHLHAPGWNVAGATAPWRPGVAVGHNDRFAWAVSPSPAPVADVADEPADPPAARVLTETIPVKGRQKPFEFQTVITPDGVVIASDRARGRQFVLRWKGFDAGTAPEMAALQIDRARTPDAVDDAASRWRLPAGRVIVIGAGGQIARTEAAADKEQPASRSGDARLVTRALFAHPLSITSAGHQRFDVGPLARPAHDAQLQADFVASDWDRSRIVNPAGQSESPDSPHFADMATLWSSGQGAPFVFSDAAVEAHADAVLTLMPPAQATTKRN